MAKVTPDTRLCLTLTHSEWLDVIETFDTWGDVHCLKRKDRKVYVRAIVDALKAQIKHAETSP